MSQTTAYAGPKDPTRAMPGEVMRYVEQLDLTIQSEHPVPEIGPLLEQTVLAGGKRLRPTLCLLMGGIFEIPEAEIIPYARIAEFVHSASLAHDDVLDMAERRRDRPTINFLSTNSKAILSGDFLVARVFKELGDLRAFSLIQDLSTVMEHLVYGEWLQEESRYDLDITERTLRLVAEFKTASLIAWCCMVPARIRKSDESMAKLCHELGISLGIGFQLIDDVIDYDPDGEKDFARDLKNGFINTVTWELIRKNPELVPEIGKYIRGEGELTPDWHPAAVSGARNTVRKKAVAELRSAQSKLEAIVKRQLGERHLHNTHARSLIELIDSMGMRSF
ncbi:MAG: polyprenyl synthetase family protein [Oligoflexia bacterium]|nr:polyprenyl synthetase family protein [Oligoflexia bacterium]